MSLTDGGPSSVRETLATAHLCELSVRTYALFTNRQEHFHGLFTDGVQIADQIFRHYQPTQGAYMAAQGTFTMKLTPEQKDEIRKVTGKDAEVIELSVEELEERIAPSVRRRPL